MLAIKNKLGSSDLNLRSYAAARGLTAPDSMSEFDSWLNPGGGGGGYTYAFFVATGTTGPTGTACLNAGNGNYTNVLYSNEYGGLNDGTTYYNSDGTEFAGGGRIYSDATSYGRISNSGDFRYLGDCGL
jgi:hypothetical protein